MQKIKIRYNPYKMETRMEVNGIDVCRADDYIQFREFIETGTPLQTWAGPVSYRSWKGIVNEIAGDEDCFDRLEISFYGRKIDFDDLRRACEAQNNERKVKLEIAYFLKDELSDKRMARNIDAVMHKLLSDRFKRLVHDRGQGSQVMEDYQYLEEYYNQTKDREFKIVFAGLYSSGKSTILNALTRHEILPMAGDTCTSKTCRIRHVPNLKDKISLECFDENGKVVVPKEIFDNDADCLNRFWEITPLGALESVPASVCTIEIGLDLSHLYPSKEMEKEFNLVIVDTPGCNSSKTLGNDDAWEDGKKGLQGYLNSNDKRIALDAITGGEKEMVVICADAQDYEDESIGDFLRAIHQSSEEDAGDFNDRFLFLLNKCDALIYGKGETLEGKKEKFANYITDTKKWGIRERESSPEFVPSIFMSCAYVDLAIQCGAAGFTDEDISEDEEKATLYDYYDSFSKKIRRKNRNFYLAQACDIPAYRKQEIAGEFNKYMEAGDEARAVAVQTGIGCLESAVRDYIARYAYPFKVRDLMNTFDALLADVTGFIEYEDTMLKHRMESLGKNLSEREEVEREKAAEEKRERGLQLLRDKVASQKEQIGQVVFDSVKLRKIREELHVAIEGNPEIEKIRSGSKMYSSSKIDQVISRVDDVFSVAWDKASGEFDELTQGYQEQLKDICRELKAIVEDMNNHSEEYDFYGYNFNSSLSIEKINRLNVEALRHQVDHTMRTVKKDKLVEFDNPIKKKTYKWWQFGKKIKKKFAPAKIKLHMEVKKDVYSAEPLQRYLTSMLAEFDELCMSTETAYKEDIETMKVQAKNMAEDVLTDISLIIQRICEFRERLHSYGSRIEGLREEIDRINGNKLWLQGLQDDIKVGG